MDHAPDAGTPLRELSIPLDGDVFRRTLIRELEPSDLSTVLPS